MLRRFGRSMRGKKKSGGIQVGIPRGPWVKPEVKFKGLFTQKAHRRLHVAATTLENTDYDYLINYPPVGIGQGERIGSNIYAKHVYVRACIEKKAEVNNMVIRLIIFTMDNDTTPTQSLVGFWKELNQNQPLVGTVNKQLYNVVYDKSFNMNSDSASNRKPFIEKINLKLNWPVTFYGNNTDPKDRKKRIFYTMMCYEPDALDDGSNRCYVNMSAKLYYTDA